MEELDRNEKDFEIEEVTVDLREKKVKKEKRKRNSEEDEEVAMPKKLKSSRVAFAGNVFHIMIQL